MPPEQATLEWSVHPVRRGKGRLALTLGTMAAFGAMVYIMTASWYWVAFSVGIFFISLARYFFRSSYTLSPEGVTARLPLGTVQRSWTDFASWRTHPTGVFLSPYRRPTRLESFRGLFLLTDGHRDRVVRYIRDHMEGGDA
jgi:hypothetical protein